MEKSLTVLDEKGFHARPATLFVTAAVKFKSTVTVEANGKSANGKSLLNLLGLGIKHGQVIKVVTSGEDEEPALQQLCSILQKTE